MRFIEFDLYSDALCMGERIKGGLLRPCAKTIRYSQISGALRQKFGVERFGAQKEKIHAAGYLVEGNGYNKVDYLIYSPRDKARAISKVPLQIEFLTNVRGKVYVLENEFTANNLPEKFDIFMGAFISKGFGLCTLTKRKFAEDKPVELGTLKTRIPLNKLGIFGIEDGNIKRPVYGYLFEPTSATSGAYVLSLFEGSEIVAPRFLIPAGKGR
jgi:hypothetical protein